MRRREPAKSARFEPGLAARTTRRILGSGPSARFLAACTPPLRSSEEGLGPLVLPFGQEPLPRRGKRLLFRVPAKSARFKTRPAARTTRRMSESGPSARFLAACTPPLRSSEKGLRLLVLPLGREPLPAGGIGSCFACRQSRRASKPGKQRAQRAESREGAWPGPPRRQRLPFLPHSALRSTSSPSGPCATCWKPAFSYRRTGPA